IHKSKWQVFNHKTFLERALAYYHRGYQQGVLRDEGYTAINAAFVLDLLADLEDRDSLAGEGHGGTSERRKQATAIREDVVRQLGAIKPAPESWWFKVTFAEACFGLSRYDEALVCLKQAAAIPNVADWEFEATARQLATLARLLDKSSGTTQAERQKSRAWEVLRIFLGNNTAAVLSAFTGKVGLALSGGGFRAS